MANDLGPAPNPNDILRKVAEAGMGVRFGRGVVAKTGYAVVAVLVIWLGVVWRIGDSLVQNCFLAGAALVASALVIWWILATQRFAERNPAQAMLDGAEFIEYKRFEATSKDGSSAIGSLESEESRPHVQIERHE
jgi:hypothetical protein